MIATLTQFKLYLGITTADTDALLQLFLDWANKMVETFLGREIAAQDYTPIVDWNWQLFLVVWWYPINTISKIERNTGDVETPVWEELDKTSYSFNTKIGRINFFSPLLRWFQNYKLTYNGWYSTIPADLVLAVCKLWSKSYNTRNSDWVSAESVAGDSISFDVSQIPNDILAILSNYRDA